MVKLPLPSRFATGNFLLTTLIILGVAGLLYLLDVAYLFAYVSGAIVFYGMVKLHGYRVRRYKILHPPSQAQFMYNIQTGLDQLRSDFDDYTLQVTIGKTEGG